LQKGINSIINSVKVEAGSPKGKNPARYV